MRYTIFSALFAAFSAASAMAEQETTPIGSESSAFDFPACVDHMGTEVQYIDNDRINIRPRVAYIGVRYLETDPISKPAIVFKRDFLHQLSQFAFDFAMAHECYHFSSGDAYDAYVHHQDTGHFQSRSELQQFEDDADCYAARHLVANLGYDYEQIQKGMNMPRAFGDRLDMSGRAALILHCARSIS